MRTSWSENDLAELEESYSVYPLRISGRLIELHGRGGCYTKALRLGLSAPLRSNNVDFSGWSETTKAYLAGIIDGEGTICKTTSHIKNKRGRDYEYTRPVVSIANTDYDLLRYLEDLKIGGISRDIRKEKYHHKQAFQWSLSAVKNVYYFLRQIYPYLVIKREKAADLMEWIESKWKAQL